MSAKASETTICVLTLNRPAFIERLLDYYSAAKFGGEILIGDGSTESVANEIRDLCERHKLQLRIELLSLPGVSVPKTFALLAERVRTKYAVYAGDDDFLIVETLGECEEFLDVTPDVIAVHGRAIVVNMNGAYGVPIGTEHYAMPSYGHDSSLGRVEHLLRDYRVGIFSLHRSDAWRSIWSPCAQMEDKSIGGEIAACLFSAALGRMAEIEGLYLVRQVHPETYALPQKAAWILSGPFVQSAQLMLSHLTDMIKLFDPAIGSQEFIEDRVWNALMIYFSGGTPAGESRSAASYFGNQEPTLDNLINFDSQSSHQFRSVLTSVLGNEVQAKSKPRLLINWGNPYVMEEVIAPILPTLADRFWIVLLLVDYKLEPSIRAIAKKWKEKGLVADVLIAPSHGGSLKVHRYMAGVAPMFRHLDFDLFLTISAMQPYERYLTDWILPEKCPRIVLWPHPTNLFLNAELSRAVGEGDIRSVNRAVRKWRADNEPKIWKEIVFPRPYFLRVTGFLAASAVAQFSAAVVERIGVGRLRAAIASGLGWLLRDPMKRRLLRGQFDSPEESVKSKAGNWKSHRRYGSASSWGDYDKSGRPVFSNDDAPPLILRLLNPARNNRLWRWLKRASPNTASYFVWTADRLIKINLLYRKVRRLRISWLRGIDSVFLRGADIVVMQSLRYHTMDRYVYPQLCRMRPIPFRRLDWLTQIGTDQFDACLFFASGDTEAHKILFGNPNIFTVRYMRQVPKPKKSNDAILMPFSLHEESDVGPELIDIYVRDLSIALNESGATEVHLRPHPGRQDDWLGMLVKEIRDRGIPIQRVTAEKPITEAAASYRGVVGAVSGSLRDVCLACPHLFVVCSVGLSNKRVTNPKGLLGFAENIGWIEADGSYDPVIFDPVGSHSTELPSPAEMVIALFEGRNWNRLPVHLSKGAELSC